MADGYRRRALTAASTLVPAACGSAGGMPCVPAARGGMRKLLGVATGGGRQLRYGWPRKAVESAFQMADQRGNVSGLIRQPLT
uniref:Uncharacterized protein n=1 Tax=Oryza sativa subsp. japonica TaxID=39947 RepID=Q2QWE2_ORYSJ|nr:hypothetical protein LOC_Os12g09650 [Oryza sativa Japonica Group]